MDDSFPGSLHWASPSEACGTPIVASSAGARRVIPLPSSAPGSAPNPDNVEGQGALVVAFYKPEIDKTGGQAVVFQVVSSPLLNPA